MIFCFLVQNYFLLNQEKYLYDNTIREQKIQLDLRKNVLGIVFEDFVRKILKSKYKLIENKTQDSNEISDIIIYKKEKLILLELKSGFLPVKKCVEILIVMC